VAPLGIARDLTVCWTGSRSFHTIVLFTPTTTLIIEGWKFNDTSEPTPSGRTTVTDAPDLVLVELEVVVREVVLELVFVDEVVVEEDEVVRDELVVVELVVVVEVVVCEVLDEAVEVDLELEETVVREVPVVVGELDDVVIEDGVEEVEVREVVFALVELVLCGGEGRERAATTRTIAAAATIAADLEDSPGLICLGDKRLTPLCCPALYITVSLV